MEMDIYMRRRLVALGGLVAFFILFVLLVKSCGGDDEPAPLTNTPAGATGEEGATPLSRDDFIAQADQICATANSAVGALDPADPNAIRDEHRITAGELEDLQALEVDDDSRTLTNFFRALEDVVEALRSMQVATQRGDDVAAGEAQVAIDEAEVEARELGDRYGFRDCGQFLDAGEAPGGADAAADDAAAPDAGTATVPDTGTETTPAPDAPPADDTAPPDDGDTGGITP